METTTATRQHMPSISLSAQIPKLTPRRRQQPSTPQQSEPVPETPALPAPPSDALTTLRFQPPRRRILSKEDHQLFLKSDTYNLILAFVFGLAESVQDRAVSSCKLESASPFVKTLLKVLDEIEDLVRENPPDHETGSRFGNKTFTKFLDAVDSRLPAYHQELGLQKPEAIAELSAYASRSFGDRNRIDYGSGHELNFAMWLLCFYQLSFISRDDFPAVVLLVFMRYLKLMRVIQTTYYLEPAGSHGVWGLDDYHFLPFLFGSYQIFNHPYLRPKSIHSQLLLEEFGGENLYLNQVAFVNSVKTVDGLRWHSPMLDDISSAKSWKKIADGMKRMFAAEVLGKLPVMQHFLFGSLIPAAEGMSEEDDYETEEHTHDHTHVHDKEAQSWGDCCGIKVPSAIAASKEERKQGQKLRRLPFD